MNKLHYVFTLLFLSSPLYGSNHFDNHLNEMQTLFEGLTITTPQNHIPEEDDDINFGPINFSHPQIFYLLKQGDETSLTYLLNNYAHIPNFLPHEMIVGQFLRDAISYPALIARFIPLCDGNHIPFPPENSIHDAFLSAASSYNTASLNALRPLINFHPNAQYLRTSLYLTLQNAFNNWLALAREHDASHAHYYIHNLLQTRDTFFNYEVY